MKRYSQGEIEGLITCKKRIADPPRKEMKADRGSLRNDMQLESLDGKMGFAVFMRINERFPENFSIGLNFIPRDEPGSFCLLRYNGPHGEHINAPIEEDHPHFGYHIHNAKAELIEAGILPEKYAEITETYASYKEALFQFMKIINIQDGEQYFDDFGQDSLFERGDVQ